MDFFDIDCLPEFPDSWMKKLMTILDNDCTNNAIEEQVSPLVGFATNYETSSYDQPWDVGSSSSHQLKLSSSELEALSSLHYEQLGTYESCMPQQLDSTYECYMPKELSTDEGITPKQSTSTSNLMVQVPSADQSSNTSTTLRELLLSSQGPAPIKNQASRNQFAGKTFTAICPDCRRSFEKLAELNFHLIYRTASCDNCAKKFCSKELKDAHRRYCHADGSLFTT